MAHAMRHTGRTARTAKRGILARALYALNPLSVAAPIADPDAAEAGEQAPAWKVRPPTMSVATWRLAKALSWCGNPFVISLPCYAATAYKASPRWRERARWWAISTAVMTLPSFVHVRYGVRTGRFSDAEISLRHQRFWPYMGELAAVLASYGMMRALRAPKEMTALVVSVAGGMVAVTGITLVWKISMHVVGTAGAVTVLTLLYGKKVSPLFVLVPLVGWSRHTLEHHSPAQIAAGAAVGAAAPLIVFREMGLMGKKHSGD